MPKSNWTAQELTPFSSTLGIFAKKAIPARTCLGTESPIFAIKKSQESTTPEDAIAAYYLLALDAKEQFAKLRNVTDVPGSEAEDRQILIDNHGVWIYGTYQHNVHASYSDNQDKSMTAVYRIASLLNHSCHPSMTIVTVRDETMQKQFWTIRDVRRGQEITFSYIESALYMTSDERAQTFPLVGMPSPCLCNLCKLTPSLRLISDLRRFLLRRLLILLQNGVDVRSTNSINVDEIMSKAAEV